MDLTRLILTVPRVLQIPLKYKDAAYRTGTYFLPSQYRYRAVPVLVVFHGLEGNGLGMVQAFMVRGSCHMSKLQCVQ